MSPGRTSGRDRALLDGCAVVGDPVCDAMQMCAQRFRREIPHRREAGDWSATKDISRGVRSTMIPSGTAPHLSITGPDARPHVHHADSIGHAAPAMTWRRTCAG